MKYLKQFDLINEAQRMNYRDEIIKIINIFKEKVKSIDISDLNSMVADMVEELDLDYSTSLPQEVRDVIDVQESPEFGISENTLSYYNSDGNAIFLDINRCEDEFGIDRHTHKDYLKMYNRLNDDDIYYQVIYQLVSTEVLNTYKLFHGKTLGKKVRNVSMKNIAFAKRRSDIINKEIVDYKKRIESILDCDITTEYNDYRYLTFRLVISFKIPTDSWEDKIPERYKDKLIKFIEKNKLKPNQAIELCDILKENNKNNISKWVQFNEAAPKHKYDYHQMTLDVISKFREKINLYSNIDKEELQDIITHMKEELDIEYINSMSEEDREFLYADDEFVIEENILVGDKTAKNNYNQDILPLGNFSGRGEDNFNKDEYNDYNQAFNEMLVGRKSVYHEFLFKFMFPDIMAMYKKIKDPRGQTFDLEEKIDRITDKNKLEILKEVAKKHNDIKSFCDRIKSIMGVDVEIRYNGDDDNIPNKRGQELSDSGSFILFDISVIAKLEVPKNWSDKIPAEYREELVKFIKKNKLKATQVLELTDIFVKK